jgi:hypothetical protein
MSPAIDFSQVKGLEPIPDGTYEATIVKAEAGLSKKGNPKIDIRWQVETEGAVRTVFDTLTFTPEALWRVKNTLLALDFPDDFNGDVEPEDLIGRSALITVVTQKGDVDPATNEPYPDRNRVAKVAKRTISASDFIS